MRNENWFGTRVIGLWYAIATAGEVATLLGLLRDACYLVALSLCVKLPTP